MELPERNASTGSKLQLTALHQVFCTGCMELDARCTARLIWAPRAATTKVQATPKSVQLHQNYQELEQCGERGCYACRYWAIVLRGECYSAELLESLRRSLSPVTALPPVSISRPWIITISTQTGDGETVDGKAVLQNSPSIPEPGQSHLCLPL